MNKAAKFVKAGSFSVSVPRIGIIKNRRWNFAAAAFASTVWLFCPALSLAAAQSSNAAKLTPQQTAQLIQELDAAKKVDWDGAIDPTVSSVRRGTFLNQMNKADRASKELSHGFTVPQSEIDDALWSPPRHISPEERAQLIRQLKAARQQDDDNEQRMLNDLAWSRSVAPVNTAIFDERKREVDVVVRDLEIGVPVHWSMIRQALVVPTSPH